jgi:PhnB protein
MTTNKTYKPQGYNSLSPYIVVAGARRLEDILKKIFNAETTRRYDKEDGTVMHMELRIDDTIIMIADSSDQYPPNKSLLHVYVPDVDAVFASAIQHGCQSMETPTTREGDPDKRGSFMDFSGNVWAIGTQQ